MKLALITDPKGFNVITELGLAYHLTLAQAILEDDQYAIYYRSLSRVGHFIMMDNGAAEEGSLNPSEIMEAAERVQPDEIIMPDVMFSSEETIRATMDKKILNKVNPIHRAVVPQGSNPDEWMSCANYFVSNLEFATLCIPKHTERWEGGRASLLVHLVKLGWSERYNVHLLGIQNNPVREVISLGALGPWVRGIDTAVPFALAQHGMLLDEGVPHVSHKWGYPFNEGIAHRNAVRMLEVVREGFV